MNKASIGIIGIGGYGARHLDSVRVCEREGLCDLKAVVIREIEAEALKNEEMKLRQAGVFIHRSYQELFERQAGGLDLVTVPAGIDQHAPQSIAALAAGFSVLCEKPVAGTLADALAMRDARDEAGRTLAIGFQYISAPSIQRIKTMTLAGELGELRSASGWAVWPRTDQYYKRNYWSGKLRANGSFIFDSPLQNAVSHFFNNLLYVAGDAEGESAVPDCVYGENYRANDIESADTQFIRVRTRGGIALTFFATHAAVELVPPVLTFIYEKGRIEWEQSGRTRVWTGRSGSQALSAEFDDGGIEYRDEMFRGVIASCSGSGAATANIDNSWQHAACVELLFRSSPIVPIPQGHLSMLEGVEEPYKAFGGSGTGVRPRLTAIVGIEQIMQTMFREGRSFHEIGAPWAVKSSELRFG